MDEVAPVQKLFFALWPDHSLRMRLNRLTRGLPEHGQRHHPDDLHMTLVFLGAVTPEQYACIKQVGDAIQAGPFTLHLDRIDYWQQPRILYMGIPETPAPLTMLVQDLQSKLMSCGFEPEKRPYKPHVTLIRKAKQEHVLHLDDLIEWPVSEFVLVGSSAGKSPPRYQVIKRWSLQNS